MTDSSWLGPPINVQPLFPKQQTAFIELLGSLEPDEWIRPTACPGWNVKDVAAHVLGDHIGRLSMHRDRFHVLRPSDGEAFPAFLDRINDDWVTAASRLSPAVLTDLLSFIGDQVVLFWQNVDMDAIDGSVSWAGPEPHPAWLDASRDFTEYWTHHQQICEATDRTGLTDPEYFGPVIDTFMRALPHTLREVQAPERTTLQVSVTGPGEGTWACIRGPKRWVLQRDSSPRPDAYLELETDTAWRLCTRGIHPHQAAERVRIDGDHRLATAALNIVSIIWTPPDSDPFGESRRP
ncbi:maleylpyruvate isomerase family mycothiol-dependent enzyme [Actinomadura alba]|uniref:maleylpyruvate isomerase family mycothiol-dependent enzyme n=1 Tax=Actinomadura alba TaxID=406431 RepID=UPI0028AC84BD|nr:maleylpyruvate isomerase family mycothiol-dependent enzyme [Actinomadura alba]